jgi:hypothetical protein
MDQSRSRFRFSLRLLLVTITISAVCLYIGGVIGKSLRPVGGGYSPDQVEFWLSWFNRGDLSQRRDAARHFSWWTRTEPANERVIQTLCDAARDEDREIRLSAARGLVYAAKSNDKARQRLQDLATNDSDPDVRQRAQQSLADAGF